MRLNLLGKQKFELGSEYTDLLDEYDVSESELWEYMEDEYGIREETNMFD